MTIPEQGVQTISVLLPWLFDTDLLIFCILLKCI